MRNTFRPRDETPAAARRTAAAAAARAPVPAIFIIINGRK